MWFVKLDFSLVSSPHFIVSVTKYWTSNVLIHFYELNSHICETRKSQVKLCLKNSSCFKLSLRGLFCKPWERYERSLVSNWHLYGWKFSSFNKKFFQTRAMTLVEFQCQNISMSVRTDIKFLAWHGFQFTEVQYLFFYLC